MKARGFTRFAVKCSALGAGLAAFSYATYVSANFLRYGRPKVAKGSNADVLLDIFMPNYEVVDRHSVSIAAPADLALATATEMDLESCLVIRAIFKSRWVGVCWPSCPVERLLQAPSQSRGSPIRFSVAWRRMCSGISTSPDT